MTDNHEPTPHAEPEARNHSTWGHLAGPDFTPGHMAAARRVLFRCIGPDQTARLVARVYGWAMGGNMAAVKLMFQYLLGKPVPMVTPDDDGPPPPPRDDGPAGPEPEPAQTAEPALAPEAAQEPALSPLARAHQRRAERRAAKKAARAARRAARKAG